MLVLVLAMLVGGILRCGEFLWLFPAKKGKVAELPLCVLDKDRAHGNDEGGRHMPPLMFVEPFRDVFHAKTRGI